jgi:hypothetical protein
MNMRFTTWNMISLHRAAVLKELSQYKLDLVGIQVSDGIEVPPNQQAGIPFSKEWGMRMMN